MSELLHWYDSRRRDLPWRLNCDPYRVWISEIMLQQTQVQTVIPYYESFLERFPDVQALAAAPLEEVLAAWSGLGYYRRARQLHRAAGEVVAAGGKFPSTSQELQRLPGIGPYTAAAVASIAFGEAVPVLDGNVERLLCRWLAYDEDPKRAAPRRRLIAAAATMLDPSRPGDSNQALMELGAIVCRPANPDCENCPLQEGCLGYKERNPEKYPTPRRRRQTEKVEITVAVAIREYKVQDEGQNKVLLFRRPEDDPLMPGMWELPNVPRSESLRRVESDLGERYGGRWQLVDDVYRIRHAITYRSIEVYAHAAEIETGDQVAEGPEAVWADDDGREALATSSLVEKVLKKFRTRERPKTRRRRR